MIEELFQKLLPQNEVQTATRPSQMSGHSCYQQVRQIIKDTMNLTGAIVECGVYKGAVLAFMARIAEELGIQRQTWGFDSFEGMPEPVPEDHCRGGNKCRNSPTGYWKGWLAATEADVWESVRIAEVKDTSRIHLVKGWFQDTIDSYKEQIGPISVLRLDGDLYESIKVPLYALYDQVEVGGWIMVHDYGRWWGSKRATDEFLEERGLGADYDLDLHRRPGMRHPQRIWQKPIDP